MLVVARLGGAAPPRPLLRGIRPRGTASAPSLPTTSAPHRPPTFCGRRLLRTGGPLRSPAATAGRARGMTLLQASAMDGFTARVAECNEKQEGQAYVPLKVGEEVAGYVLPGFAEKLAEFGDVFQHEDGAGGCVRLSEELTTPEARTEAVAGVTAALKDAGVIGGWRNELYPVVQGFQAEPLFLLERAAAPFFGIKAYGVHVNGYVTGPAPGEKRLWVARRSATKPTWPGLLDHIVAGGLPHGISAMDNVVKECEEEASIPESLGRGARPVGAVSYETSVPEGLKRDVLLVYDIELPESFVPTPCDGEVDEFFLWPIERVVETVSGTKEYKPNCNLVVIDFLIRHGYISADQPGYLGLLGSLRAGDCS